jgi:nickel-dependent lactate racemase
MYEVIEKSGEKRLKLPREYWFRRDEWTLGFPRDWDVNICRMRGDQWPVLTQDEIGEKLAHPVGSSGIAPLARGKREVAIVVDDMTRPTEASSLARYVIDELRMAGIKEDNMRFLVSLGCHGAHDQQYLRKKLGDHIVENYRVYNHNCYENCIDVGKTRRGIPLKINSELMRCDLKIGIGAILPHLYVGYSGGGKIVLPGLAHIDTIDQFHSSLLPEEKGKVGTLNPLCGDIEDAVRLVGLDFKIDVLVNTKGQSIDLYAGHPVDVYKEGIKSARSAYGSETYRDQDIVIANAYLKANEGDIALLLGFQSLRKSGGTCVLIMNSPTGQMTHYLMRSCGKYTGGRQWVTRSHLPDQTTLVVLSEYKDMTSFDSFDSQEDIIWMKSWQEVLGYLKSKYPGETNVGIYPDGTIQYV